MVPLIIRGSGITVKQYSMMRFIFFAGIISGRDLLGCPARRPQLSVLPVNLRPIVKTTPIIWRESLIRNTV